MRPALRCAGCGKAPAEIEGYVQMLLGEPDEDGHQERLYPDADAFVWAEEGTLNRKTGLFLCDDCYIRAGMPSAPGGWVVPDASEAGTPADWERMARGD